MQKISTTYICDNCQNVLSDDNRNINKKHLSFNFQGRNQGWVSRCSGPRQNWQFLSSMPINTLKSINQGDFYQFCDYDCLKEFFDRLVNENQLKKIKE